MAKYPKESVEFEIRVALKYQPNSNGRRGGYHDTYDKAVQEGKEKIALGHWEQFIVYEVWCSVDKKGRVVTGPKVNDPGQYR